MKLVVKVGGASIEVGEGRSAIAQAVSDAGAAGHEVVVVHGGGSRLSLLAGRLGLMEKRVDGLRVTDAATAEIALMVLGGAINRELVAAMQAHGVDAIGLTGADGNAFTATPMTTHHDLGYVGSVAQVRGATFGRLLEAGFVPVIASVAPLDPDAAGPRDRFYNINADHLVGPVAAAIEADVVLFLTDVPGVLDENGALISTLNRDDAVRLRDTGIIGGGMIPKTDAALHAARHAPAATVKIASAAATSAVLGALDPHAGTAVVLSRTPSETNTSETHTSETHNG